MNSSQQLHPKKMGKGAKGSLQAGIPGRPCQQTRRDSSTNTTPLARPPASTSLRHPLRFLWRRATARAPTQPQPLPPFNSDSSRHSSSMRTLISDDCSVMVASASINSAQPSLQLYEDLDVS